jgi:hypothetical protein
MSFGKLIGMGNTSSVYEWEKDKVVRSLTNNLFSIGGYNVHIWKYSKI